MRLFIAIIINCVIFFSICHGQQVIDSKLNTIVPSLSMYETSLGKYLISKYEKNLHELAKKINSEINLTEIEFVDKKGLGFFSRVSPLLYYDGKNFYVDSKSSENKSVRDNKGRFLGILINYKQNLILSDIKKDEYYPYIVHIINSIGEKILNILINENCILNDSNIDGYGLSIGWNNDNHVEIYIFKDDIEAFQMEKIQFIDLLRRSVIYDCSIDHGFKVDSEKIVKELIRYKNK